MHATDSWHQGQVPATLIYRVLYFVGVSARQSNWGIFQDGKRQMGQKRQQYKRFVSLNL